MAEKLLTLDETVKVDLKKSIEENSIQILKSLKENKISFSEFSNYILNKKEIGTLEDLDKKTEIYKNTHELYFKEHLSNKLSKENKNSENPISNKEIGKATVLGVSKIKDLFNDIQNDLTDKKASSKIKEIINEIVKNFKTNNLEKPKQEKNEDPKLMFKKDDVVFYMQNDNIRVAKVLKDSFNQKETILKPIVYDKQEKSFITLDDKLIAKDNNKLSKPFKYKNISFDSLTTIQKLDLVMGKQTSPIKTQNQYKTKVDGVEVQKIYEQDVKFQLKINKKKGLIIPKIIRPFQKQAYGKEFSKTDLDILKKGGVLINDAINKKGKHFEFTLKYDKSLKGVVVAPFNSNYLTNKKGVSNKAYIAGNTLNKKDIQTLLKGKPINLELNNNKKITIGFSENSSIIKRLGLDKEIKESIKAPKKKTKGLKIK